MVSYRHSLPLHGLRRLVLNAKFLRVFGSVLPVRLKRGCGHSSSTVEKTVQDVAIHVPGKKQPAFGVTCAKLIVTRSNPFKRPCEGSKPREIYGQWACLGPISARTLNGYGLSVQCTTASVTQSDGRFCMGQGHLNIGLSSPHNLHTRVPRLLEFVRRRNNAHCREKNEGGPDAGQEMKTFQH